MYCEKCGSLLRENSKFCEKCGAPVAAPAGVVVPPPAVPNAGKKASGSGKKAAIIVGIVLGSLVLIGLILWLLSSLLAGTYFFRHVGNGTNSYEVAEPADAPSPDAPYYEESLPTSNPYYDCYNADTGYVLPESNLRYYSRSDISTMSLEQLDIAYYEIAARHGATFQDPDVQEYFNYMRWYTPGSDIELSQIEITNQEMLLANRALLDGSIYSSGNPYIRFLDDSFTYMIPDSQNRYLDSTDLKDLSADELQLVRSEIYGRHGYIFKGKELREFFYCKDWYVPGTPNENFDTGVFSDKEYANVELIRVYEKLKDGVEISSDNPYMDYYYYYGENIIYDSSSRKLTEDDVYGMTKQQLILARNEIFARKGYVCSDQHLFEYFAQCSWFVPETAPGDLERINLNNTETANANFLKKYQELVSDVPDLYSLDTALTRSVETPYFTVKVPKYFKNYCEVVKGKDDGVYNVKFYETLSKGYDSDLGRVFTITIVPSSKSYTSYTNYSAVGSIRDNKGNAWNILIRYPAGVEWTGATSGLYFKMQDEVWRIMDTLSPKSGYTFSYSMAY